MCPNVKINLQKRRGLVLVLSMIFLAVFTALAVSLVAMAGANLQIADDFHRTNSVLSAAFSALECGRYIVATTPTTSTGTNTITEAQVQATWTSLCAQVQAQGWVNGQAVQTSSEIITPCTNFGQTGLSFRIKFSRQGTHTIKLVGYGYDASAGTINGLMSPYTGFAKNVSITLSIKKDAEVLNYAIASRGRMWLTGNSSIHGDIFSSWNRTDISPFNVTSDSSIDGTINTVLSLNDIKDDNKFQLETLDVNDKPVFDENNQRVYSSIDEVQGNHKGINYSQLDEHQIPGMSISDYDTDCYNTGLNVIPSCPSNKRKVEYFPHASGNYTYPRDGTPSNTSNVKLTRHVYENQTFTNTKLPSNYNALFKNCTFKGVLYVDCNKNTSTNYNNVRFDDCSFNGPIITNVPQSLNWQKNCLYFTGQATFQNTSAIQEATILAPHFNVNLGNTNPQQGDNNVLTGAIVGGIVDIRGNAQIYGTIISMCDTTGWSSGYVTNIGATLGDGGSETTEAGDIGVISITPNEDQMLPSGIKTPIVIKPLQETYSEI